MRCLTEGVRFHEARNSRRKEQKSDVQMLCSLCVEYVELLSQKKSGAVLTESRRGEDQTGAVSEKKE